MLKFRSALIIVLLFNKTIAQERIIFKDFNQINLEDLTFEGDVGKLLMKAHLNTNIDSTVYFIKAAEKLSYISRDTLLIPYINYHLGYAYFNKLDYSNAEMYLYKCINYGINYNLDGMLYESYNLLGVINSYQNKYNLAIHNYKKSLSFSPTRIDSLQLKINISTIYIDSNKTDLASLYIDEVLQFDNDHPNSLDPYWLFYANLNKSNIEISFDDKLGYINRAIKYAELTEDLHLLLQANIQLAGIYLDFNKYIDALTLSKLNLNLAKQYNYKELEDRTLLILAKANYQLNNNTISIKYLDSINFEKAPEWIKINVNQLAFDNYVKIGNYKGACIVAGKQIRYLDSLVNVKDDKAYAEYAKKYQTEKKINENKLLLKEKELIEVEMRSKKTTNIFLWLMVVIVIVAFIIVENRFRLVKKLYKTVNKQNKELEIAIKAKKRFFSIIAHDLINPFNSILGYTQLLQNNFDNLSESEKKEYIKNINKGASANYNLVENLLEWVRIQEGRFIVKLEFLNIQELVNAAIEPYKLITNSKNLKVIVAFQKDCSFFSDKNVLKTVIANLFSNAIKFTQPGGSITIQCYLTKTTSCIEIRDTGVGMSNKKLAQVFSIDKKSSTLGTNKEKGSGLGLIICNDFVKLVKGELKIESSINKGTKVKICLPKKRMINFYNR